MREKKAPPRGCDAGAGAENCQANGRNNRPTKQGNLLDYAQAYARRGWSIIPVRGKKAACPWKELQKRCPTAVELDRAFHGSGLTGLAVVCGPVSGGLTVRDFDEANAYPAWAAEHPDLAAELPTVKTARGHHLFFRSDVSEISIYDDGELRGGGIVLLPPSLHPSGILYEWIVDLPYGPLPLIDPYESGLARTWTPTTQDGEDQTTTTLPDVYRGTEHPPHNPLSPSVDSVPQSLCPSVEREVQAAIERTLPPAIGRRHRCVFLFAQELRAIPSLAGVDPVSLEPIVREWHVRALPTIGTVEFHVTWGDFLNAWMDVRFPAGTGPMADAISRAEKNLTAGRRYELPAMRKLVALCEELQRHHGDEAFYLSCRKAGEVLDVHFTLASACLRMLVKDGVLVIVKQGKQGRGARATRYKYLLNLDASEEGGAE